MSSGAASTMALRWSCCGRAARAEGGGRGARDRVDGVAWEPEPASRPGRCRWPAAARSSPAYGRHVADASWDRAGAARAGEWGRGKQAGPLAGPKGRRGWPGSACPFSIFFRISFLKFFSKFIWTNLNSFSPLAPKSKVVPKQKPYNFVLISKTKFQIEFELRIKTSSRFSNKFILGIFI